jgi:salicylate 5-hydroxylase small subunit
MDDVALRFELAELYARYAACLDGGAYEQWPEFFTEDCRYLLTPRENHDAGMPLATMSFEGKGMLKDRVYGVTHTLFHAPYYQRHIIGSARILQRDGSSLQAEANYLVVRTHRNEPSEVFCAGRYVDRIVIEGGRLLFAEKRCIFDSELILNSVIYPI